MSRAEFASSLALSVALLPAVFDEGMNELLVCATDRGADVCACCGCAQIIAGLAGVKCFPVQECEKMYDNLINKIFIKHPGGGMKLALKQVRESDEHSMLLLSFYFHAHNGCNSMVSAKHNQKIKDGTKITL